MKINGNRDRLQSGASKLSAQIARSLLRSSDLQRSLEDSSVILAEELGVALVRIWLFHGVTLELSASAGRLVDDGNSLVAGGQFSVGYVVRLAEPYRSDNIRSDPRLHDKEWAFRNGLHTFAGVPILLNGKPEGILAVFDDEPISTKAFEQLCESGEDIALALQRVQAEAKEAMARAQRSDTEAEKTREHAVIVTTPDGRIADWSTGAEILFGVSRGEAIGTSIEKAILFDTPITHDEWIRQLSGHQNRTLVQIVRRRKDDALLHIRMTISPLGGHNGEYRGAVVVAHDLADVDRLRQVHEFAQKAGILGSLMGAVTHDFNNLLTIIQGYGEILENQLIGEDQSREWLAEITKAAKKGETLVRQILDLGRKRPPLPAVLNLNTVVEDLEKSLARMVREDIAITIRKSPEIRSIVADAGHMHQVLLNLVINACDAMPHGGSLTIATRNADSVRRNDDSIDPLISGCFAMFSVTDTGIGIDTATRDRIFEPYFTTKKPGLGTGIGLSNAQAIVAQYGGMITVNSAPGQGTTFCVFLPSTFEAHMIANIRLTPDVPAAGTETILIVEDSDAIRNLIKCVLSNNGYHVLLAGNGEEALSVARSAREPIHLVITDVIMPRLSGNALAEELAKVMPAAKVLFISGHTDEIVSDAGINSKRAFLGKPFTNATLTRRVRELLDDPGIAS